jgi:glycosyltransferase involved in cell wall biosynthesis
MDSTVRVLKKAPDETKADIINFFDILPEKKSKYAVCVIPANDSAMELLDITRSGVKKYAEKCGADYIELSGDQNPNWTMSNKYRLNRVAKTYDKTLYLDCDIVVKNDAPNIFELTPDDKISAYDEYEIFEQRNDTGWIRKQQESIFLTTLDSFPEEIKEEYVKNGEFITESMINGGVLVIPNALADYYKQPSHPYTKFWCFDQHLLTLELPEEKFNNLTHKFNCEYEGNDFSNLVNNSHFIHLNGLKNKPELRKSLLNEFSLGDFTITVADLTIVIPCHNYARYLGECLKSLADSSNVPARVIVVDDSSDDDPEPIARKFGADFIRIESRDPCAASACVAGFKLVSTKFVSFVDADDIVDPEYFITAIAQLDQDPAAAFVYPWLEAFGEGAGPRHGTENAPIVIRAKDIEVRNWCPTGSIYRSAVLRQSLALRTPRDKDGLCNDWITARNVLRAGNWKAIKAVRPLHYRIHHGQTHTSYRAKTASYAAQANLKYEVVSIVVAFSGRWNTWGRLRDWILSQTWPLVQTRLLILNSSHETLTASALGLDKFACASLQIERIDIGMPGLADLERRGEAGVGIAADIEAAVAGLYNAAATMVRGEWMFFAEDDTIPLRPDAIERLMRNVEPRVAAISGMYKHRYEDKPVAFNLEDNVAVLQPLHGPEVERVDGSGFGCLLARRSVLLDNPLAGDSPRKFYDVDIAYRLKQAGWEWILDRSVTCDHLISKQ